MLAHVGGLLEAIMGSSTKKGEANLPQAAICLGTFTNWLYYSGALGFTNLYYCMPFRIIKWLLLSVAVAVGTMVRNGTVTHLLSVKTWRV